MQITDQALSLPNNLGTPTSTEDPGVAGGIANTTVGVAAEKVLSGAAGLNGLRRVKIVNPTAGVSLGYTTVPAGATAPTLTSTVAGGGAADGSHIFPSSSEVIMVPCNADLYLAASGAASKYQLTAEPAR